MSAQAKCHSSCSFEEPKPLLLGIQQCNQATPERLYTRKELKSSLAWCYLRSWFWSPWVQLVLHWELEKQNTQSLSCAGFNLIPRTLFCSSVLRGDKEDRILGTSFCGIRLNNAIVIKGAELYKKTEIEISWTLISKAALVWNQLFSENCFNELTASLMLRFHKAFLNSTHTKNQVSLQQKNARFVVIFSQRVKSTPEIFLGIIPKHKWFNVCI